MGKLATPFLRTRSHRGCILRPGIPSFIHAFILANAVSDSIKITTTTGYGNVSSCKFQYIEGLRMFLLTTSSQKCCPEAYPAFMEATALVRYISPMRILLCVRFRTSVCCVRFVCDREERTGRREIHLRCSEPVAVLKDLGTARPRIWASVQRRKKVLQC
jgi:hypothetical protein